jgi:hypothetical protein
LLNDQYVIEEIREEIKISWNLMKIKTQPSRNYGTQQRHSKEESLYPQMHIFKT